MKKTFTMFTTPRRCKNGLALEELSVIYVKLEDLNLPLKGVLHLWALFLKTLCIFSKNKATSDKVSYGSGQKCSKELENNTEFYFSRDHCCEVTVKNVQKSIFAMF